MKQISRSSHTALEHKRRRSHVTHIWPTSRGDLIGEAKRDLRWCQQWVTQNNNNNYFPFNRSDRAFWCRLGGSTRCVQEILHSISTWNWKKKHSFSSSSPQIVFSADLIVEFRSISKNLFTSIVSKPRAAFHSRHFFATFFSCELNRLTIIFDINQSHTTAHATCKFWGLQAHVLECSENFNRNLKINSFLIFVMHKSNAFFDFSISSRRRSAFIYIFSPESWAFHANSSSISSHTRGGNLISSNG